MNSHLFRTVTLVLIGTWLIFLLVNGWRPSLWLIPAIFVGLFSLWYTLNVKKPQRYRSDVTSKRRAIELLNSPTPSRAELPQADRPHSE